MLKTIRNAWSIPDLRKKLLFTLMIIIVFRIGSVIPVPFLDMSALATAMNGMNEGNTMLAYLNTLSGGAFANATLFAMGVTPYINSSIIMQLLTVAIPPLERMAKEGEAGRRKIGTITRYEQLVLVLFRALLIGSISTDPVLQFTQRVSHSGSLLLLLFLYSQPAQHL